MAKYSDEFKLIIVKEYLEGFLGYQRLAQKYGMPDKSPIQKWVNSYQALGKDNLRRNYSKKEYSVQFKLDVLNFKKETGASYQETADRFSIPERSIIANWNRIFLKKGVEGLEPKPKGRPSMSKKTKSNPPKKEKGIEREEQLEREIELLRLEVSYLKKLKAFQENPDAYLEKHKQRWRLNSSKKDSN